MKKDTPTCSLVFLDSIFHLIFALISTNRKTIFWSFPCSHHGSYNHPSSTLTKRFSNISGKVEVYSLFLRSTRASCLSWDIVHFSWWILPKYQSATALCIHKLYNTFLRCSTKLHIKHIHKHYTYKTLNPTAIATSYVPMLAFFLILITSTTQYQAAQSKHMILKAVYKHFYLSYLFQYKNCICYYIKCY